MKLGLEECQLLELMIPLFKRVLNLIIKVDLETLFSDESTISEEVPIGYEKKVAIYDDYCDDIMI